MTHPFTDKLRCTHCRTWHETWETLALVLEVNGRVLKFCDMACSLGWGMERGVIPLALLPEETVAGFSRQARPHQATRLTRQGDPHRNRRKETA